MRALVFLLALACAQAAADDLYVFWRRGCSPCEKLKAALLADPSITAGYTVHLIDTQKYPELASKHKVSGVPVLAILRDGKELKRRVGFADAKELTDWMIVETRRFKR